MELLKEGLRLFGHEVAVDVYYKFLDYTACSDEGDREEERLAPLARLMLRLQ